MLAVTSGPTYYAKKIASIIPLDCGENGEFCNDNSPEIVLDTLPKSDSKPDTNSINSNKIDFDLVPCPDSAFISGHRHSSSNKCFERNGKFFKLTPYDTENESTKNLYNEISPSNTDSDDSYDSYDNYDNYENNNNYMNYKMKHLSSKNIPNKLLNHPSHKIENIDKYTNLKKKNFKNLHINTIQVPEDCVLVLNDMDFQITGDNYNQGECEKVAVEYNVKESKPINYLLRILKKIGNYGMCSLSVPETQYMKNMITGLLKANCCTPDINQMMTLGGGC